MNLSEHYRAAYALSPKAAKLAGRMLDSTLGVPFEWRFALRIALTERGCRAAGFTVSDYLSLTGARRALPRPVARLFENPDQAQALSFVRSVREAAGRQRDDPGEAEWT